MTTPEDARAGSTARTGAWAGARGFKKDWGYSKKAELSFLVAKAVFRITFGKSRKIDLFMGG
ncbi:hypothetical protein ACFWEO_18185 [Streptomyces roseolus]|uniref:hypothetical protein n=1 Tax=Streptomyces roseolus TaxID=67358 RepID=UPI003659C272